MRDMREGAPAMGPPIADGTVDDADGNREGKGELPAIGVCRAYVAAQREYASEDRDGSAVFKYAQRIRSTSGKRDGLYWRASPDDDQSPFGPLVPLSQTS